MGGTRTGQGKPKYGMTGSSKAGSNEGRRVLSQTLNIGQTRDRGKRK